MYEHGLSSLQENASSSSSKANTIKLLKVLSYDCINLLIFTNQVTITLQTTFTAFLCTSCQTQRHTLFTGFIQNRRQVDNSSDHLLEELLMEVLVKR